MRTAELDRLKAAAQQLPPCVTELELAPDLFEPFRHADPQSGGKRFLNGFHLRETISKAARGRCGTSHFDDYFVYFAAYFPSLFS